MGVSVGVIALCAVGAGAGVHAAAGDDSSQAALLAQFLGSDQSGSGSDESASGDGGASHDGGDTHASDAEGDGGGSKIPGTNDESDSLTPNTESPKDPTESPAPDGGAPDDDSSTDRPDDVVTPPTTPAPLPATDPMSPKYNPYTTAGDPSYLSEVERTEWLGTEVLVRECMAAAGFDYGDWQWWYGGSPQPGGQSDSEAAAWSLALRGDSETNGCRGDAKRAAADAAEQGAPLSAPLPPAPGADVPTEREHWLEFQSAVRSCMAERGFEYVYWEYWNPIYDGGAAPAAMPPELEGDARAAWNVAAFGTADANTGGETAGGCWGSGRGASGYTSFD